MYLVVLVMTQEGHVVISPNHAVQVAKQLGHGRLEVGRGIQNTSRHNRVGVYSPPGPTILNISCDSGARLLPIPLQHVETPIAYLHVDVA